MQSEEDSKKISANHDDEGYNETFEAGTRELSAVEKEIEDFYAGSYVSSFEEGETRIYKFDKSKTQIVDALDYNQKPIKKIQYTVCDAKNPNDSWKKWSMVRVHKRVWEELKKGYTVLSVTHEGTARKTKYIVKGIR